MISWDGTPESRPQASTVFSRGTGGSAFFHDEEDRRLFVNLLVRIAEERRWRIHAYCLMTTHYHLVVETKHANLSAGMQRLNSIYALSFNHRWGRFGTLVAGRFGSRAIESEEYLIDVCTYVFLNPVRANLCERASQWPWSGGLRSAAMSHL